MQNTRNVREVLGVIVNIVSMVIIIIELFIVGLVVAHKRPKRTKVDYDRIRDLELRIYGRTFTNDARRSANRSNNVGGTKVSGIARHATYDNNNTHPIRGEYDPSDTYYITDEGWCK
jgi:hypothetical protein